MFQPQAMRWRGVSVLTNTPPRRAQSQPGGMQGIVLMEPMLAKAARKLGRRSGGDPPHQRAGRQGQVRPGRIREASGAYATSAFVKEALDRGAELFKWDERKARSGKRQGSKVRGYGVATSSFVAGSIGLRRPVRDQARRPDVHPVRHRQSRHRVDERLPSRRRPRWSACRGRKSSSPGATPRRTCRGAACRAAARRRTRMTRAAHAAATDAIKKLQEIAAKVLGGRPEDYEVANERVLAGGGGGMTLAQAAQKAHRARRQVRRPRAAREHQRRSRKRRRRRWPVRG